MTDRDPEILNEEEAVRLWRRAAQLQAEAAQKAEASDEPESEEPEVDPPEGYALTHVRAAALEAGIGDEFVEAALVDLRADRALPRRRDGRRLARRFLGGPPETITVRRVIEASVPKVLSAMEAIFSGEPYRLTLRDQQGDPLDRGVLVFEIQGIGHPFPQGLAAEAGWAGYRQVLASLRPIEGATPSCEVTLRGPVARAHNLNLTIGGAATVLGSAGGAVVGALGLTLGLGPVAAVLAGVVMVGGAVAGGGLAVKGYRALYRYGIGRGRRALDGLLGAVVGRAQGGWGITSLAGNEPARGLPGSSNPTD